MSLPTVAMKRAGELFVAPDGAGWVAAWINIAMFMPPPHLPNTLIKSNLEEERSGKKRENMGCAKVLLCRLLLKESEGTKCGYGGWRWRELLMPRKTRPGLP